MPSHSGSSRRGTTDDASALAGALLSTATDDRSLLPAAYAPTQLFRTRGDGDRATFQVLPRIILQLANGFLSLKEIGAWCNVCRDVYATAAFFRCPVNSLQGGIRHRWAVLGRDFTRPQIWQLLKSPLRLHVTIIEATDSHGGLIKCGDFDRMRALPYLTDIHAHYRFSKPWDWADEIERLVLHSTNVAEDSTDSAFSSSSSSSAPPPPLMLRTASLKPALLPPFRSLMLCPHDSQRHELPPEAGDEPDSDSDSDSDDEAETISSSIGDSPAASNSSDTSSASESAPAKKEKAKAKAKPKDKNKMTQAEWEAEDQRLADEEKVHLAKWAIYNTRLFSKLCRFGSLHTLGLNLIGNSTEWDVSGFRELYNLHVLELDVESPWNHAFARQLTDIIEFIRDVPYRSMHRLQSNALHVKHLQQLMRPRRPADANQEQPPIWSTLHQLKAYSDGAPELVRVEVDQWESAQNERFIIPFVQPEDDPDKMERKIQAACELPSGDEIIALYSLMSNLRMLDIGGLSSTPPTDAGYARLTSFAEIDTLAIGGLPILPPHPDEDLENHDPLQDDRNQGMAPITDALVQAMATLARKNQRIDRLLFSNMIFGPQSTTGASASSSEETPAPPPPMLHDVLFHYSSILIELDITSVIGLKDLSAIVQCTKLQALRLVDLPGFRPTLAVMSALSQLKELRVLRLARMLVPHGVIDRLTVPSNLVPSLEEFTSERPHLHFTDPHGAPIDNFDFGNLPAGLGWIATLLASQGLVGPAMAAAADATLPITPSAPITASGALELGPLYSQLYAEMIHNGETEAPTDDYGDLPELIDDELKDDEPDADSDLLD